MNEAESLAPMNYQEQTHTEIIQAAARVMAKTALQLLAADMHRFGSRPCQTCASISTLLGEPFGCLTYNDLRKAKAPSP